MSPAYGAAAVALVTVATLAIGAYAWRFSQTTSDFFVASRAVRPGLNASAIGGEYLSAASFLGVAGLVLAHGADMLWYPVGWTAGYLVMLVLVAAPLRRSGAYTVPDFAEGRLESTLARRAAALLVLAIGWLYLLPQFRGAGLALRTVAPGTPTWLGGVLVGAVVLVNVLLGGMRSITVVQAFQYWLKLTALLVPALFLLAVWAGDGATSPADVVSAGQSGAQWSAPTAPGGQGLYTTYSLIVATFLGTMGLPHVVVRFYANPDGNAARRTALVVLAVLGAFYLLPPVYAALGRLYAEDLVLSGDSDSVVLALPGRMVEGVLGDLLSALTAGGAFAAFLSTSSGLTVAVAGVLSQDVLSRGAAGRRRAGVRSFRSGALIAVLVPLVAATTTDGPGLAGAVGLAFAFAASTFCPLMVLGIWWRRLTDIGAVAGMAVGGLLCGAAVLDTLVPGEHDGWTGTLLAQPAAWTVPAAFATTVVVSLLTPARQAPHVVTTMIRLHTPEAVALDRGELRA